MTQIGQPKLTWVIDQIREENILSSINCSFEPSLLVATEGKGADVILNSLSGSLLQSSLACIADFGRFLHIGDIDLNSHFTLNQIWYT